MIKKKITWLKEKKKNVIFIKNFFLKNNILQKSNMYIKYIPTNTLNNKKLIHRKNICLKRGKYNNNFGIFKLSRHYIKYLIT